ncbi:MAG: dimethyl sulfoxide reductase anchor subunit [Anaerolineales bacterium]|nr:dimethyl sulfoxide reductase anchor subunit [Anaerolineales bacterium]
MNLREWALPVYTILMQLAAGALLVLWIIRWLARSKFSPRDMDRIIQNPMLVISFTVIVAMLGAHFHLSKPFHSFYAVRNFQTSWLSREIIFTVIFFLTVSVLWFLSRFKHDHRKLITSLGWLAILFGFIVVYCMARIYLIPTQVAWNSPTVIISFYTTTLLLGSMAIACLLVLDLKFAEIQKADDIDVRARVIKYSIVWLTLVVFLTVVVNIVITFYQLYFLGQGDAIAQTSLQLLFELYTPLFVLRLFFISIAPLWLGYAVRRMFKVGSAPQSLLIPVYMSCLLILIGEIIGRFLFYATHIRVGI